MKNLIAISAVLFTTACNTVPNHEPIARIAVINATNALINEGYSAEQLMDVDAATQDIEVGSIKTAYEGIIGVKLDDRVAFFLERYKHNSGEGRLPGYIRYSDMISTDKVDTWIREAAAKRI